MKYIFALLTAFISFQAPAQTVITGGAISGSWSATGSPYLVQGEIFVPDGAALSIDAGVEIIFADYHGLIIDGNLLVNGSPSEPVVFRPADDNPDGYWRGIFFP